MKFISVLIIFVAYVAYLRMLPIVGEVKYHGLPQLQITEGGMLLNEDGTLVETGWATQPIKQFNPQVLGWMTQKFRLKQWDYYHFSTAEYYFGIAFADIGYSQNIVITFYCFANARFINREIMVFPLINEPFKMLQSPIITEDYQYNITQGDTKIYYNAHIKNGVVIRDMEISFDELSLNFTLFDEQPREDIVTLTPIDEKHQQFFYNLKSYNCLMQGQLTLGQDSFNIIKENANWGMDWGRGVWNYNTYWLWMSGQGFTIGRSRVGINLGGGFQHSSATATEESIFINHKLYKLKNLEYKYDESDLSKHIEVITHGTKKEQYVSQSHKLKDGDFHCEFIPMVSNLNAKDLVIVNVHMQQQVGYFSGSYVLGHHLVVFQNVVGIVEFNRAKW